MSDLRFQIIRSLIALTLLSFATFAIGAQERAGLIIQLWPDGKMPGKGAVEPQSDLPERPDKVQRTTNISRPTLEIFPAAKKNSPAIIISPGGGYRYLVPGKEGKETAE